MRCMFLSSSSEGIKHHGISRIQRNVASREGRGKESLSLVNYPCVMRSLNVFYTLEDKFSECKMDIDLKCIVNKFPMPQIP
jgi:hypothetical protein